MLAILCQSPDKRSAFTANSHPLSLPSKRQPGKCRAGCVTAKPPASLKDQSGGCYLSGSRSLGFGGVTWNMPQEGRCQLAYLAPTSRATTLFVKRTHPTPIWRAALDGLTALILYHLPTIGKNTISGSQTCTLPGSYVSMTCGRLSSSRGSTTPAMLSTSMQPRQLYVSHSSSMIRSLAV